MLGRLIERTCQAKINDKNFRDVFVLIFLNHQDLYSIVFKLTKFLETYKVYNVKQRNVIYYLHHVSLIEYTFNQ
jgi:hypothetical protein